ncbi:MULTISPECIES: SOS response-associated peptidase [Saccharopolyspora]|uniref:Abasic site processing protein n=2 Tax=Saccharopolyspora TaxID=1835 RepID=A0A4R4VS37_9PSEU|nr:MULTISPECIES: SOS response-associated peptidase [Saccharopolyspora]MBQ0928735.1 SOS response-associated peptidase [Saccharopolyspora endophytica]TDD08031.1 SOS response-associated peptidase [Saccharopolyspora terrae]
MCGRYASSKDPGKLAAEFAALDATGGAAPGADFNVAPTKRVLTVVQRHPQDETGEADLERTERSIRVMRWGLVPFWAKDKSIGSRMINAKSETVTSKPAFRSSIKRYRCLVPADGWYEWKREGGAKQPYFMTPPDGSSLAMAGIYSTWRENDEAEPLVTCSVLTAAAVGRLTDVHDRMPLLLPRGAWSQWLDPDQPDVSDLLAPPSLEIAESLEVRPVSTAVNSVRNNGVELLDRVSLDAREKAVGLDREQ